MRKFLLFTLFGGLPFCAFSQHYFHTGFWTRVALTAKLTPKLNLMGEVGMRRQNNLHHLSPIENPQTRNGKFTLTYQFKHLNVILSPYENIYSYPLLGKDADLSVPRLHELRFSGGLEYIKAWAKSRLQVRSVYEYRKFDTSTRYRNRTRLLSRFTLSPKTLMTLYDEVFLNLPPNRLPNAFNQNRLSCTFTHSITSSFDVEAGYVYVFTERFTLSEFDHTNGLILYLMFKL